MTDWPRRGRWLLLLLVCLLPGALVLRAAITGNLGANPVEELIARSGIWTLRFLLITLLATPLAGLARRWRGMPAPLRRAMSAPLRHRRLLGLVTFGYAACHLTVYVWLDQYFAWSAIWEDVSKRPYITVGFTAWLILLALAVTSSDWATRKMGPRRWQALHKAIYPASLLVIVHFWWQVKADTREPLIYALLLLGLLMARRLGPGRSPSRG